MRIAIPACLAAVALLGGAMLSGCQQDRAQGGPATRGYNQQPQNQDSGAVRPRGGTAAPRQQDGTAGGGN